MKKIVSIALAFMLMFSVMTVVPDVKADAVSYADPENYSSGNSEPSICRNINLKLPEGSAGRTMLKDTSGLYDYYIKDDMAFIMHVNQKAAKGSVVIPETLGGYPVVYIGNRAFYGCDEVTDVTFPANMIYIQPMTFYGCAKLKNYHVKAGNQIYTSVNGVVFSKDRTILCLYPYAKGDSYTVPSGTKTVDDSAFCGAKITSVYFPTTLKEIGEDVFAATNLKYVKIPDSVTTIKLEAFANCRYLTGVTLPNTLETISEGLFMGCVSMKNVYIPDSVKTIERKVFSGCNNLEKILVGKGVNNIYFDEDSFRECDKLQEIKVSPLNRTFCDIDGVLYSKDKTTLFVYPTGKKATRYNIPASTKTIESWSFLSWKGLNITHLSIPEGVNNVEGVVFCGKGGSLKRIYFPESSDAFLFLERCYGFGVTDNPLASDAVIYCREDSDIAQRIRGNRSKYKCTYIPVYFERIAGSNRFKTSVEISDKAWNSADTVILANGLNYADALAGVSLGGKFDAPILLTAGKASLEPEVLAQIEKLSPSRIILLGGAGAISEDIENSLDADYEVVRLAGLDRFATALEIGKYLDDAPETAIIVTGRGYADSLSISPIAAMNEYPIIYADPVNGLTDEAIEYLADTQNIIIVGGTGVVTEVTENQLSGKNIERIFGTNRYLTSYAVADRFRDSFGDDVMIATGMNFPDALAGGVLAAKLGTPLLLTHDMGMIDEMKAYVDERTPDNIYVLGGEGAVPSLVPAELYH